MTLLPGAAVLLLEPWGLRAWRLAAAAAALGAV